jgi:PHD/YefM family antitoxin component YafN of YafNO toxin-antitoxin module
MHTLTIKSTKPLILIPVEEYEGMKETLALLAANPDLPKELREQRRRIAKGEGITWVEFKKKYKVK